MKVEYKDKLNNFVRDVKEEHARIRKEDISNLQQDMETQAKQVRSGWITAFMNMKTSFGEALGNLRGSINELEMREIDDAHLPQRERENVRI